VINFTEKVLRNHRKKKQPKVSPSLGENGIKLLLTWNFGNIIWISAGLGKLNSRIKIRRNCEKIVAASSFILYDVRCLCDS
jgi:hypothetical protein